MVTDMNLGENVGATQQSVNAGGGGGRRKSKGGELTQKKNKQPQRGMGVEQLERIRLQTQPPSLHPHTISSFEPSVAFPASCTTVPNFSGQFRPAHVPSPEMLMHGIGIHRSNLFSTDRFIDSSVIGSGNVGCRFENTKELYSIPNYIKCASDGCGVCHKKKRINGGSNACSMNQFGNFSGNNAVVEIIDSSKTRRGQVTEVMPVHRNGGIPLTEYEFFPGKGGGVEGYNYTELMRMKAWCGSGNCTSAGGMIGLRGGEGSCVTAISGSEEGGVSSLDLSLKL